MAEEVSLVAHLGGALEEGFARNLGVTTKTQQTYLGAAALQPERSGGREPPKDRRFCYQIPAKGQLRIFSYKDPGRVSDRKEPRSHQPWFSLREPNAATPPAALAKPP